MAKPETRINTRLSNALKHLRNVDGHRVELRTGERGRPDWDLFIQGGRTVFIETKFIYAGPNQLKDWTQVQRNWASRKIAKGFPVFILLGGDYNTYLLDADSHIESKMMLHPLATWGKSISPEELWGLIR